MFAGGGVGNGVIKLLASHDSENNRIKVINAALAIFLVSCGLISLILIIGAGYLSRFVFGNPDYKGIFFLLAVSQIFVGIGNLILAIFSSRGQTWVFTKINLYGTLTGLILFALLIYSGDFSGAAYGLVALPAAIGFSSLWILHKEKVFKISQILTYPDRRTINQLLSYSLVMLVAVSVLPLSQMITRNYMGGRVGWTAVGYWQGVLKVSDMYMQFIGIILINYALPKFAKCDTRASAIVELKRTMIPLLGITAAILIIIYFGKIIIIKLIFNKEFLPMQSYFLPQLLGDLFRTIASTIMYLFLAKNNKILPIISEIFQGVAFFGFTVLLYPLARATAPVYSHLLTFSLLAIFMGWCFSYYLKSGFSGATTK